MAQSFFPVEPTNVTPAITGSWRDVDVSARIPEGATGVILHIIAGGSMDRQIGIRKKGSTDNRIDYMSGTGHFWTMIGVDSDRIFQAYISDTTDQNIYLVGYTGAGVTYFTNAINKSLSSTGEWTDIDCSVECPGAKGLIFEVVVTSSAYRAGFRKKGSTDNRLHYVEKHNSFCAVIGCDANQIAQAYISNSRVSFYLLGYITDGVTFNTNATDVSLGNLAVYTDLAALPSSDAVMGIFEVCGSTYYKHHLRKKGSTEDLYARACHSWAIVECDEDQIVEGKIENLGLDYYLVGYASLTSVSPPAVSTDTVTSVAMESATFHGNITDTGGEDCSSRGFQYGKISGALDLDWHEDGAFGVGEFTAEISSLDPGTTYYVRAYAINSGGTTYGAERSFLTPAPPVIMTNTPSGQSKNHVVLNGTITNVYGYNATRRGFQYGRVSGALDQDWHEDGDFGAGAFNHQITGLDYQEVYFYRAYATNDWGTAYGLEQMLITVRAGQLGPVFDHQEMRFGYNFSVVHVADNIYAMAGSDSNTIDITTRIINRQSGEIGEGHISSLQIYCSFTSGNNRITRVRDDVFAVFFQSSTGHAGIHVATFTIDNAGNIGAVITTEDFDGSLGTFGTGNLLEIGDTGTAKIYLTDTEPIGANTRLLTVSIKYDGTLINLIDTETVAGVTVNITHNIKHVAGDIYAVLKAGNGAEAYIYTFTVTKAGAISAIDSSILDASATNNYTIGLQRIASNIWLAIYYITGTATRRMRTFYLYDDGTIGTVVDTNDTVLTAFSFSTILPMGEQTYLIVGDATAGNWAKSVFVQVNGAIRGSINGLDLIAEDDVFLFVLPIVRDMYLAARADLTSGPKAYLTTFKGTTFLNPIYSSSKKKLLAVGAL